MTRPSKARSSGATRATKARSSGATRAAAAAATTAIVVRDSARDEPLRGSGCPVMLEPDHWHRYALDSRRRPLSLWTAIRRMSRDAWHRMALEAYGLTRERDRQSLVEDCVFWDAKETNRVTTHRERGKVVRWDVWIDPTGSHRVSVWPE